MKQSISLIVNHIEYLVEVEQGELLVDVLKYKLGLTGTKKGCGTGECGSCTVIINNRPVTSCLVLAVAVEGKIIQTIESLEVDGCLHPLQRSFIEYGAVQCGYCTPGVLMMAKSLLEKNHHPSTLEIQKAISGNLCRCTGYLKIIQAIQAASQIMFGNE